MKTPELIWIQEGFDYRAEGLLRVYRVKSEPLGINRFRPAIQRGAVTFICDVAFEALDDAKHFCQSDHESIATIQADAREGWSSPEQMANSLGETQEWFKRAAHEYASKIGFKSPQEVAAIVEQSEFYRQETHRWKKACTDLEVQLTAHTQALKVKLEPTLSLLADLFEVSEPPLTDRIWEELKRLKTL